MGVEEGCVGHGGGVWVIEEAVDGHRADWHGRRRIGAVIITDAVAVVVQGLGVSGGGRWGC